MEQNYEVSFIMKFSPRSYTLTLAENLQID